METGGTYRIHSRENDVHIDDIRSRRPGNGFGAAVVREAVTQSLKKGGSLTLEGGESSHIFHLYMGMLPNDVQINYVEDMYGNTEALQSLNFLKNKSTIELFQSSPLSKKYTRKLIEILKNEKKEDFQKNEPTLEDVFKHRDFLLELASKMVSRTAQVFVPALLDLLEENKGEKYPNTSILGSNNMHLSSEGEKRWREAIDNQVNFVLFYNFEQLHPYMNEEQKERLKTILEKKAGNSKEIVPEISTNPIQTKGKDSKQEVNTEHFSSSKQIQPRRQVLLRKP